MKLCYWPFGRVKIGASFCAVESKSSRVSGSDDGEDPVPWWNRVQMSFSRRVDLSATMVEDVL